MNNKSKSYVKGLALSFIIAIVAFLLSSLNHALDALVISILFGIIVGNLIKDKEQMEAGINMSTKVFIPLGITLYGSQLSFYTSVHPHDYLRVILTMALYFIIILWLSKKFALSRSTGLLLASGSAICGASAIVVLAPIIDARKEETSISLISITIVGLTGVILYPVLQRWFSIPLESYAFLAGATLPQLGLVEIAASALGVFGNALHIKLLRIAMLAPIAIAFSLPWWKIRKKTGYHLPWFILTFIMAAILFNVVPTLRSLSTKIEPIVRFVFSIALAGVGLSIDLDSILEEGPRPLFIAFIGWISVIILFTFFYFFSR